MVDWGSFLSLLSVQKSRECWFIGQFSANISFLPDERVGPDADHANSITVCEETRLPDAEYIITPNLHLPQKLPIKRSDRK